MRVIVQRALIKKIITDFIYYERNTIYKILPNATNFLFDLEMESATIYNKSFWG